jgi:hypothetical protein
MMNRRGAAQVREKRRMDVQATVFGGIEYTGRHEEAKRDSNDYIEWVRWSPPSKSVNFVCYEGVAFGGFFDWNCYRLTTAHCKYAYFTGAITIF